MVSFGFFKGMTYGDKNEDFDDYRKFKNKIPKANIIKHIEQLPFEALCACVTVDIFTKKTIPNAGIYVDGDFEFPIDFLYYLKNYDIGIPPEYEKYLSSIGI